ncbi:MAG TPA: response regulator transcription factor, partial [Bacteroidales bacterium]|nr:response regulator transcription factor [Bacteroidales bacterium]
MKVLIAEDHVLVREGLKNLLIGSGLVTEVVEATNGLEALLKSREANPDLVLLDYEMPVYNGIFAAKEILAEKPNLPILMVSMYFTKEHVMDAVRVKVKGFVSKGARSDEMIEAIRALSEGKTWFKGTIAEFIAEEALSSNNKKKLVGNLLTDREQELIAYFANGMKSAEIAEHFHLSKRTVEVHKSNIFKKLRVRNNSELVRYAV